jgi:AbrB family looped-hinge helix DNA binding protein
VRRDSPFDEEMFFGAVTVGERGQVVIPAEGRKKMGLEAGDKVLVFYYPYVNGVMIAKVDQMHKLHQLLTEMMLDVDSMPTAEDAEGAEAPGEDTG